MEKSVELLSALLKTDANSVSELLSSEEGITKLETQVKELKTYTTESFSSVVNNLRKDQKDQIYGEVKGATLEMLEKELQKEHSTEFKKGEDYNTTAELVAKINAAKTPTGDDSELKTEIASLQELLKTERGEHQTAINDINAANIAKISDQTLKGAIKALKSQIDVEDSAKDGQLRLFEIAFKEDYQIRNNEEGNQIVWDVKKGEVVKSTDTFSPLTPDQVVQQIAPNYLPIKDVAPKKGRGSEFNKEVKSGTSKVNWSKYGNDFDNYYDQELKGKGIMMGSEEVNVLYRQFKTETA
jgi:hypothetical protein